MALIHKIKNCNVCNVKFSPKKGVSYLQWSKSEWCSRACFNSTRLGIKHTEEHNKNISLGNIGKILSKETKNKISKANTGKVRTEEANKKNSIAHIGIPSKIKGLKILKNSGANHWAWKKDRDSLIKNEKKHLDGRYREWMKLVKDRDIWSCRITDTNCSGKLEAHHILRWSNFPELRYEVNNGISLCHFHHPRKIKDEMRLSPYFMDMVNKAK